MILELTCKRIKAPYLCHGCWKSCTNCRTSGLFETKHPQTDGLVERFNKMLKTIICTFLSTDIQNWDKQIDSLLAIRYVPQASTGFSPLELLYGRRPHGISDVMWLTEEDTNARQRRVKSHSAQEAFIQCTYIQWALPAHSETAWGPGWRVHADSGERVSTHWPHQEPGRAVMGGTWNQGGWYG